MFGAIRNFVLRFLGREAHKRAPELTEAIAAESIRQSLESMEVRPKIQELAREDLPKVSGKGYSTSPSVWDEEEPTK